jgi:hypothetical protein
MCIEKQKFENDNAGMFFHTIKSAARDICESSSTTKQLVHTLAGMKI